MQIGTADAPERSRRCELTEHAEDQSSAFVYYGSRASQPTRARAFIDLAVERLAGNAAYVLTPKELAAAESKGRKAHRPR